MRFDKRSFDLAFCKIGWHQWGPFTWSTDTDRVCACCGVTETLRLVDMGRSRCWVVKPNPPAAKPTR